MKVARSTRNTVSLLAVIAASLFICSPVALAQETNATIDDNPALDEEASGDKYIQGLHTCKDDAECLNGGVCTKYDEDRHTYPHFCDCVGPFKGTHCEETICLLKCENGGTCQVYATENNDWEEECDCPDTHEGSLCQLHAFDHDDDRCDSDKDCFNGGYCIDWENDARQSVCECPSGVKGHLCELDTNPCNLNCQNGGACVSEAAARSTVPNCDCPSDWTGDLCQYDANDPAAHLHTCTLDSDCLNGGECFRSPILSQPRYCACLSDFSGTLCEDLIVVVSSDESEDTTTEFAPPSLPNNVVAPDSSSDASGLSTGAKVGISAGVVVIVAFLLVGLVILGTKRAAAPDEVYGMPHKSTPDPDDVDVEELPDVI